MGGALGFYTRNNVGDAECNSVRADAGVICYNPPWPLDQADQDPDPLDHKNQDLSGK